MMTSAGVESPVLLFFAGSLAAPDGGAAILLFFFKKKSLHQTWVSLPMGNPGSVTVNGVDFMNETNYS